MPAPPPGPAEEVMPILPPGPVPPAAMDVGPVFDPETLDRLLDDFEIFLTGKPSQG